MALQQISANDVSFISTNGGLQIPTGTTAQRPGTPSTGLTRYNTTTGQMETYSGSSWNSLGGLSLQSVQTSNFTAVAGNMYPANTSNGSITVTLPSSPIAGQQVGIFDYAGTTTSNIIKIYPNGQPLNGNTGYNGNVIINTARSCVTLTYIDTNQGWADTSYHGASQLTSAIYSVSYLIVAGGGGGVGGVGGVSWAGSGGGAGGMITGTTTVIGGTSYTITVGSGGSGGPAGAYSEGANGVNSSAFTVTALGGGKGAGDRNGYSGGSGGGTAGNYSGGSGTPGQGNPGGSVVTSRGASGGGGAGSAGTSKGPESYAEPSSGASGGSGLSSTISGSPVYYAGGGGGGGYSTSGGSGGTGGGGNGGTWSSGGSNATTNTGGGGGGSSSSGSNPSGGGPGGSGGSGIIIISYAGAQIGSGGTVTSSGSNTIHTFTSSGTFTA